MERMKWRDKTKKYMYINSKGVSKQMKRRLRKRAEVLLLTVLLVMSGLADISVVTAKAASAYTESEFTEEFDAMNTRDWHKANGWTNGGVFNCDWRGDNVAFHDGKMELIIDQDATDGVGYSGGEYRTNHTFHYGKYQVSM